MPGPYIHMETAKKIIEALQSGNIPSNFPGGLTEAKKIGDISRKWRNYLAAGAIGPDIFFLLNDFKGENGNVLLTTVRWVLDTWDTIDMEFISKWEKWAGPVLDTSGVVDDLTGGTLHELGLALQELSQTILNAFLDLISKLWDWFGLLTSGVPQGYSDNTFYWSDMFHYRKTYEFAKTLLDNAKASGSEQLTTFALGWITHCATDVTGHAFVNEKCGGPFRLHWQRHHLVENHMDSFVYEKQMGIEPYGHFDTSALHFRLAFRPGLRAPYLGRNDAPVYDYFARFPQYDTSDSRAANFQRNKLWDLDTAELPEEVCKLIIDTMEQVYGNITEPKILTYDPPQFRDGTSGRPSVQTIQDAYTLWYDFIKMSTTGGYSPPYPTAPPFFNDHSPPFFPGTAGNAEDDESRGGDVDEDDFNILDLLLAILFFVVWLFEAGTWLLTLPAAVLADILTYPAREALYEFAVVPLWNAYISARKPLVMSGFLVPKREEISQGLIQLGVSTSGALQNLRDALDSADGMPPTTLILDEMSGRAKDTDEFGDDVAYPRAIIKDEKTLIADIVQFINPNTFCGQNEQPSEFLSPWKYPDKNNAGDTNGWEPSLTHSGPFLQGETAASLIDNILGDDTARNEFEKAESSEDTEKCCSTNIPQGKHLGGPIDYGLYLIGKFTSGETIPDFNLDSDRGYAYHCWDWNRNESKQITPDITPDPTNNKQHTFNEPCTPPEGYCQDPPNGPMYDPNVKLAIHYLDNDIKDPGCESVVKVTDSEIKQAGMSPRGKKRG